MISDCRERPQAPCNMGVSIFQHATLATFGEWTICARYVQCTHQNVEVQGIETVRVLHGWASQNGMESIYITLFPSQLPSFDTIYVQMFLLLGGTMLFVQ